MFVVGQAGGSSHYCRFIAALTLEAVVAGAVDATGSELGFVAGIVGDGLRILTAAGASITGRPSPGELVGQELRSGGTAGWVVGSGQPVAVQLTPEDPRVADEALLLGGEPPKNVLCVPCVWDDEPLGALQLVNKYGGAKFTFDDVEIVTLLGTVAGAALAEDSTDAGHRSAVELGGELRRLESADPATFRAVATMLEALLGRS